MKALTLTQPYATLISIGAKTIESRPWMTFYRGPLAIHAAIGLEPVGGRKGFQKLCATEPFASVLTKYTQNEWNKGISVLEAANLIPRGVIVAVCDLVAIKHIGFDEITFPDGEKFYFSGSIANIWYLTAQERAFGDYTPGRYAWLLKNVQKLATPIPVKGALGLWEWDEEGL